MQMDPSQFSFVQVDVDGEIVTLTLNRPEALNACDFDGHKELAKVLRAFDADPGLKVAVVTGAGRAFSVGGDLDLILDTHAGSPEEGDELLRDGRDLVLALLEIDKPIVAAVNGHAMGAGAAFALLCDFIIMEEQAVIADGHIRAALAAGDGGVIAWPLAMGLVKAKQYLMTGDWIDAAEADRRGLVTEVVGQGESLVRARAIAARLAAGPQLAIRYTKRALNQWAKQQALAAFDYSLVLEGLTFGSPDVPAAVADLKSGGIGAMPRPPRREV